MILDFYYPKICDKLFIDNINSKIKCSLLYNYAIPSRILTVNTKVLNILRLCNGKNSVDDIARKLCIKDSSLHNILEKFREYNIIDTKDIIDDENNYGLTFWLYMTYGCNLNCKYCFVKKSSTKMNTDTAKGVVDKIIDTCKNNNINNAHICFGGGEPFLNYNVMKYIVNYSSDNKSNINFSFGVVTNGTLFDDEKIKFISDHNFNVLISLDGIGKHNDKIRHTLDGTGTYDIVINNVKKIRNENISFKINYVITDTNIFGVYDFIKLIIKNNYSFNLILEFSYNNDINNILKHKNRLLKQLNKSFDLLEKNILNNKYTCIDYNIFWMKFDYPSTFACGAGRNLFGVDCNGNFCLCSQAIDKKIVNFKDNDNLLSCSKKLNAEFIFNSNVSNNILCDECRFRFYCKNGCPVYIKYMNGKNPYCFIIRALGDRIIRLYALSTYAFSVRNNN